MKTINKIIKDFRNDCCYEGKIAFTTEGVENFIRLSITEILDEVIPEYIVKDEPAENFKDANDISDRQKYKYYGFNDCKEKIQQRIKEIKT